MDAKLFGEFLQQRRKELGLTQSELAEKIHVTDKAISRWERGVGFPDIKLLEPLAEALDLTLAELLQCRKIQIVSDAQRMELEAETTEILDRQQKLSVQRRVILCLGYAAIMIMCSTLIYVSHHAGLPAGMQHALRFISLIGGLFGTRGFQFIVCRSWMNRKPWGIWHNYYAWVAAIVIFSGFCLVKLSDEFSDPWNLIAVLGGAAVAICGWIYYEIQKEEHGE